MCYICRILLGAKIMNISKNTDFLITHNTWRPCLWRSITYSLTLFFQHWLPYCTHTRKSLFCSCMQTVSNRCTDWSSQRPTEIGHITHPVTSHFNLKLYILNWCICWWYKQAFCIQKVNLKSSYSGMLCVCLCVVWFGLESFGVSRSWQVFQRCRAHVHVAAAAPSLYALWWGKTWHLLPHPQLDTHKGSFSSLSHA